MTKLEHMLIISKHLCVSNTTSAHVNEVGIASSMHVLIYIIQKMHLAQVFVASVWHRYLVSIWAGLNQYFTHKLQVLGVRIWAKVTGKVVLP